MDPKEILTKIFVIAFAGVGDLVGTFIANTTGLITTAELLFEIDKRDSWSVCMFLAACSAIFNYAFYVIEGVNDTFNIYHEYKGHRPHVSTPSMQRIHGIKNRCTLFCKQNERFYPTGDMLLGGDACDAQSDEEGLLLLNVNSNGRFAQPKSIADYSTESQPNNTESEEDVNARREARDNLLGGNFG